MLNLFMLSILRRYSFSLAVAIFGGSLKRPSLIRRELIALENPAYLSHGGEGLAGASGKSQLGDEL